MGRKSFMILLVFALVFFVAACSGGQNGQNAGNAGGNGSGNNASAANSSDDDNGDQSSQSQQAIKIGMLIEQTGFFSWYGQENQNAAELFAKQWNANPDNIPLKLIFYDTLSDPVAAVSGFKKFVETDGVDAVVGVGLVNETMALVPMASDGPILYSLSGAYKPEGKYLFGSTVFAGDMQRKSIQFLKEQGIQSFALISTNDDTGQQASEALQKIAEDEGLSLTTIEYFNATDQSVTSQLTKIANSDAEALVAWVVGLPLGLVFQGVQQIGLEMPVVFSHGNLSPDFMASLASAQPEIAYVPATKDIAYPSLDESDPQYDVIKEFHDLYVAEYNAVPGLGSGTTWDTLQLLMNAFTEVGTDQDAVVQYLENVQGHIGVAGIYNMSADDHRGLGAKDAVMLQVIDGKFHLAE